MTKRFCDYCGKEVSASSMEWQQISVLIGEVLTVAVNIYKQHSGDTDLCHVCYADALSGAADNVRANLGCEN